MCPRDVHWPAFDDGQFKINAISLTPDLFKLLFLTKFHALALNAPR